MIDYYYKNKKRRRCAKILKLCLSNRKVILGLSCVILGLGISTFDLMGSLFTLDFWQGCSLLTFILKLSSPLASLFALDHFNLLALVTGLFRPNEGVGRRKKGLGNWGLSRGKESRSRGRREIRWNFLNVFRVKHVLSKSPLRGSRDSYSIECLRIHPFIKVSGTSANSSTSWVWVSCTPRS